MSMRRDDFQGLPSLNAETINSHVSRARRLRSEAVNRWLRLRLPSPSTGQVVAIPSRRAEQEAEADEPSAYLRRCA